MKWNNTSRGWRTLVAVLGLVLAGSLAGCGTQVLSVAFPDRILDSEGNTVFLEQITDITGDAGLTEEEQRQAIADLGIEDPDLIDALLTL